MGRVGPYPGANANMEETNGDDCTNEPQDAEKGTQEGCCENGCKENSEGQLSAPA